MEDVIKARESIAMTRGNPGGRIAKLIDAVLAQIPVGSNRIHISYAVSSEESGLLPVRLQDFSFVTGNNPAQVAKRPEEAVLKMLDKR